MSESAPSDQRVVVYTDGGCAPTNPGPGGWAAILIKGEHQKELKGAEPLLDQQPHGADGGHLRA